MSLTIVTNHVPRLLTDDYELSDKEWREFDYLNRAAIERGEDSATFFRYRETIYDFGEVLSAPEPFLSLGWTGYSPDTMFSGIVIRPVPNDPDRIIVGRYYT